jgi:hypothetical protein
MEVHAEARTSISPADSAWMAKQLEVLGDRVLMLVEQAVGRGTMSRLFALRSQARMAHIQAASTQAAKRVEMRRRTQQVRVLAAAAEQ